MTIQFPRTRTVTHERLIKASSLRGGLMEIEEGIIIFMKTRRPGLIPPCEGGYNGATEERTIPRDDFGPG